LLPKQLHTYLALKTRAEKLSFIQHIKKSDYFRRSEAEREAMKKRACAWNKANPDKILARNRNKQFYLQSPSRRYAIYKSVAKHKKQSFEITLEYFKSLEHANCHYCGDPLERVGVDRIKSSIGYIESNCVPCCFVCNRMKNSFHYDEFMDKCVKVANNYKLHQSFKQAFNRSLPANAKETRYVQDLFPDSPLRVESA